MRRVSYSEPSKLTTIESHEVEEVVLVMKLERFPCCLYDPSVHIVPAPMPPALRGTDASCSVRSGATDASGTIVFGHLAQGNTIQTAHFMECRGLAACVRELQA